MQDYDKQLKELQAKVGIGIGSDVTTSGEAVVFEILKQKITPPYCIFDVGSNKGQFATLIIDNIQFEYSSIHCFEPVKKTFEMLKDNINKRCIDKRIILNNIGIGSKEEKATLYYDTEGSGLASLTRRKLDYANIYFNLFEKATISTIDGYCEKNSIDHIHLLKLDTEGHELFALGGATNMLDKDNIDLILFEFGGCNIDTRIFFKDFWYFLTGYNFRIYRITPNSGVCYIPKYNEIHEQFRTTNYLATRKGV